MTTISIDVSRSWSTDPLASYSIHVATPPCDTFQHLRVIYCAAAILYTLVPLAFHRSPGSVNLMRRFDERNTITLNPIFTPIRVSEDKPVQSAPEIPTCILDYLMK
jgi:hypothetical protein